MNASNLVLLNSRLKTFSFISGLNRGPVSKYYVGKCSTGLLNKVKTFQDR